jgi:hypothetical protein
MASTLELYNSFRDYANAGVIDLTSAQIYLALIANTYTEDLGHTLWSQVSANEVAAGSGYTAGGANIQLPVVSYVGVTSYWSASNVTWANLTKTFRYGALYLSATVKGIVRPLIAIITFDATPADVTVSGVDFTIQWNALGILSWS